MRQPRVRQTASTMPEVQAAVKSLSGSLAALQAQGTTSPLEEQAWQAWADTPEQSWLADQFAQACATAYLRVVDANREIASDEPLLKLGVTDDERAQWVLQATKILYVSGRVTLVRIPKSELQRTDFVPGTPYDMKTHEGPYVLLPFSSQQARAFGGSMFYVTLPTGLKLVVDSTRVPVRSIWRPNPNIADQPDSPVIRSLSILGELAALTELVKRQSTRRQSILLMPSEIVDEVNRKAQVPVNSTDFMQSVVDSLVADKPPVAVVGQAEYLKEVRFVDMATKLDAQALSLRTEALRRLAVAQDAPPKMLMAMGGTGGTSSRYGFTELLRDTSSRSKVLEMLSMLASDLTRLLLRKEAVDQGYKVVFDTSHLPVAPGVHEYAIDLLDRDVITDDEALQALGFDSHADDDRVGEEV